MHFFSPLFTNRTCIYIYIYIHTYCETYILTWGPHAVAIHRDMRATWAPSGGGLPLSGWTTPGANEPVVPLGPMSRWMSGVLSMRVYIYMLYVLYYIYIYVYIHTYMHAYIHTHTYIYTHVCSISLSLSLYIYICHIASI